MLIQVDCGGGIGALGPRIQKRSPKIFQVEETLMCVTPLLYANLAESDP